MPNDNSQKRSSQDAHKWGLNTEAQATLLRVGTRPECAEDNLRELT